MIKFELFSVTCIASNINWKNKTITINHNIEYIIVNIEHYIFCNETNNENDENNDQDAYNFNLIKPFKYSDISKYWIKNINKYNKLFNINFTLLKIGIDYSIAPIYVSRNKNEDLIVIGVFLLNNNSIKYNEIKPITNKLYTFLSNIDNTDSTDKTSNKYKIFSGILEHNFQKNNNYANLNDKIVLLDISNSNYNSNYKIPLLYILANACNYLPKLDIIVIKNKYLQGSFKIRQIHNTT